MKYLKNILLTLFIVVGLSFTSLGSYLVHQNYKNQLVITDLWKTGQKSIHPELAKMYSEQASKEAIFHLGLIVIGVSIIATIITNKISHNNRSKGLREHPRNP